jgi:hypothetical protein
MPPIMGYSWNKNCSDCGKIFIVDEWCQTDICSSCYKNEPYHGCLEIFGILWLLIGGSAFLWMSFSLIYGNWLHVSYAIIVGLGSFTFLFIPDLFYPNYYKKQRIKNKKRRIKNKSFHN